MLKLYSVSDAYLKYLKEIHNIGKVFDPKINKRKNDRPYLGIVLKVNNYNYFAPLSTPKKTDYSIGGRIRQSTLSIFRMVKDENRLLGTIKINNMIPVPITEIVEININSLKDIKYQMLLMDEVRWIQHNDQKIIKSCKILYYLKINEKTRVNDNNQRLLDATLDFKLLEEVCDKWVKEKD